MSLSTFQGSLRGVTFGRGTIYPGIGGIDGLGIVEPTGERLESYQDGVIPGADRYPARILRLPFEVLGTWTDYRALAAAFRLTRSGETTLDLDWPGCPGAGDSVRFYGRPKGLSGPLEHLESGRISCFGTFECTDPYAYALAATSDLTNSGTFTILAADLGDVGADTVRATVTFHGNSGTPVLTNTTDASRFLRFTSVLGATTAAVDLSTLAVSGAFGNSDLRSDSGFRLIGGTLNSLTLTGAASVDIAYQPAYLT